MKTLDFMKARGIALVLSIVLVLASIGSVAVQGLNLGLDFTGGTLLEVKYQQPVALEGITDTLEDAGYRDVTVQNFGSETDVLVRMSEAFRDDLGNEVLGVLQQQLPEDNEIRLERSEFVGSQVGEELRDEGGLALLMALAVVMIYVAVRFQFKFSVGAVAALFHDVIIVVGLFSLFQWEFDLNVLAALLAVIGYSLNDTIVVSDRIRENFRILRRGGAIDVINESLNQTLGRTLMTSLTTALVLFALMVFGGEMIHGFAVALMIGVLVGTYSSIYVAANILLLMKISREDLMPPELEEVDDRP
ncbi:protein translocase subunit SecF [Bacterioplanes sanyensis]|uniref:Protein-export membrane protein SecF n=1 Tax=Bacterioplanes sanyensis TaxID=1249553 RepID=A0A222FLF5_9GAMM|nr:protein translocase subunit SecF [Bacterioplanes sanyensis]ASP39426.1 protein translocase subunit SecF [Bacterioplanes sanyensis]